MKSDFLIKKALPVILCAVLVISMILIGIAPSEALASETVVREEQVSFNDYEDAKVYDSTDDYYAGKAEAYSYRGNSFPVVDPDDSNNKVLNNRTGHADWGIIVLGDKYTDRVPSHYITVQKNVTYKITFKWKYQGTQVGNTIIGVGLSKPCNGGGADSLVNTDYAQEITRVGAGTYNDTEWNGEEIYFTVDPSWDLGTYKHLVLYTQNTNTAGVVYFDDITVTSLAKYTETVYADNDFQMATVIDTTHETPDLVAEGTPEVTTTIENWVWGGRKYSGSIIPTYDPTDDTKTNVVLRHRPACTDLSIIRLTDSYASCQAKDSIAVTSGTTYEISFEWMTEGVAKESPYFGVALAQEPDTEALVLEDLSNAVTIQTISDNTQGNLTWQTATVYFTVTEEMNIADYPQLVLFAYCGGSYQNYPDHGMSIYFDDVRIISQDNIEYERYTDDVLANNDYQNVTAINTTHAMPDEAAVDGANPEVENWIWTKQGMYYSGQIIPTYDPTDAGNIVLRHRPFVSDVSAIRLLDEYTDAAADQGLTVVAGTTYKISFKWMTEGKARDDFRFGIALAKEPDVTNKVTITDTSISDCQIIKSLGNGTEGNLTWQDATAYFTVTEEMNLAEYPQLVIYADRGGNYNKYAAEGNYGMSIYFDDITVSVPAAATVNYCYGGEIHSEYYKDGVIKDYQPLESEGLAVTWYTDEAHTQLYDFNTDYTEYKEITLYGKGQHKSGDVNDDGSVNGTDIIVLRDYLADAVTVDYQEYYDVNSDAVISVKDLVCLRMLIKNSGVIDDYDGTVSVESNTVAKGSSFDVSVCIDENCGITAMRLFIEYDSSYLTLTNVKDEGLLGESVVSDSYDSPFSVAWIDGYNEYTATGKILTLTFTASDEIDSGEVQTSIKVYIETKNDVLDGDLIPVSFEFTDGVITIKP